VVVSDIAWNHLPNVILRFISHARATVELSNIEFRVEGGTAASSRLFEIIANLSVVSIRV
jgi:hypothetical protein